MNLRSLALPILAAVLTLSFSFAPSRAPSAAKPDAFDIDPSHSFLVFRCSHMGASWTFGRFNKMEGAFSFDAEKPEDSNVTVAIDVASIDTADQARDDHLRGSDFFDVKQFPKATFQSTTIKKKDAKKYSVTGDFTLHGVKTSITIDMERVGEAEHPQAGRRSGYYGEFDIAPPDYGVKFQPDALGKTVKLMIAVEGVAKSK